MITIKERLKKEIKKAYLECWPPLKKEKVEFEVDYPSYQQWGDYFSNIAFKLSNLLKKPPFNLAQKLKNKLKLKDFEIKVAPPGFLNFYISESLLKKEISKILKEKEAYPKLNLGKSRKTQVEFISANPTGPLHLGNARGGPLGDVLASVLKEAGFKVEREFYVNDLGRQTENFVKTLIYWYRKKKDPKLPFPKDGYPGDYLKKLSLKIEKNLKNKLFNKNDDQLFKIFKKEGLRLVLQDIKKDVKALGIRFNKWVFESHIKKTLTSKIIDLLVKRKVAISKEGALWFSFQKEFLEDRECVLVKSDGNYTYFANDIAYHYNKFKQRKFSLVIDIWGANHFGHVPRVKAALKALDIDPDKLKVILYQSVHLKKGDKIIKMAKRKGTYLLARDVLKEVGRDVFRYFMIMRAANSHLDFDIQLAKTKAIQNPVFYIQYVSARIWGILNKIKPTLLKKIKKINLKTPEEIILAKTLIKFPEIIENVVQSFEVHYLAHYSLELAQNFHKFYDRCRVIEKEKLDYSRLSLVLATQIVLKKLLNILGISAPKRM